MEKVREVNHSIADNLTTMYLDSPVGLLEIQSTDFGVRIVHFTDKPAFEVGKNVHNLLIAQQLSAYFDGKRTTFDVPFDLEGTPFQQRVWQELLKIPFGKTRSYMDIAKALGDPKAIRAVGTANGSNKIAIVIPCHRVIQSTGTFGQYHWGSSRKTAMIGWEASKTLG